MGKTAAARIGAVSAKRKRMGDPTIAGKRRGATLLGVADGGAEKARADANRA